MYMAIEEPKTEYVRVQHDKQEMSITERVREREREREKESTIKAMKIKLIKP